MKVKTTTLFGAALDWAVYKCEHLDRTSTATPHYSSDWAEGGPILEREHFDVKWLPRQQEYYCYSRQHSTDGLVDGCGIADNLLVAAMRCYVNRKLGDEVDIPEELT